MINLKELKDLIVNNKKDILIKSSLYAVGLITSAYTAKHFIDHITIINALIGFVGYTLGYVSVLYLYNKLKANKSSN